jgi:hypothetical protein
MAASSAQALEEVLMDLVPSEAALDSSPTLSTPGKECSQRLRLWLVILAPTIASGSNLGNENSLKVCFESKAKPYIELWL